MVLGNVKDVWEGLGDFVVDWWVGGFCCSEMELVKGLVWCRTKSWNELERLEAVKQKKRKWGEGGVFVLV